MELGPICVSLLWPFCVGPSWQSLRLISPKLFEYFFRSPSSGITEVASTEVPKFDGQATSFADYEGKVLSWRRVSTMGPGKQASRLLLHMSDVAVGKDVPGNSGGVDQILEISRGRLAPNSIGSISQDVVKFMYFKRTAQTIDTCIMEFERLRQKAEARMLMGFGLPDEFASILRMQNAGLSKNEKTMVLASLRNTAASPNASPQVRRVFGPCGYASRQDVFAAQDMDTASEEGDFEAWIPFRRAERAKGDGGDQGKRDKSLGGSVRKIGLIGERANGIAVSRAIASTATLRNVRKKRIGTVAPTLLAGLPRNRPTNPIIRLPWKPQLRSTVRRGWRPWCRSAVRSNPFSPRGNWEGNLRALRRQAWWSWTPEPRRIWSVTNGWRTIMPFWQSGYCGQQFHIPPQRDSNLGADVSVK